MPKYLPPPTKYGPGGSAQGKSAATGPLRAPLSAPRPPVRPAAPIAQARPAAAPGSAGRLAPLPPPAPGRRAETIQPIGYVVGAAAIAVGTYGLHRLLRRRTTTCRLLVANSQLDQNGLRFCAGAVEAYATDLTYGDRCIYEMAWNAAGAPVGHDGFAAAGQPVIPNQARNFVPDRAPDGRTFDAYMKAYFDDRKYGRFFYVRDAIEWPDMPAGAVWRFRLRVVNVFGSEVGRSQEVVIDWDNPPGRMASENMELNSRARSR